VIELTEQFIPSTDEVYRLQRGRDPECVFFQDMANHGHYGGQPDSTRQGIYVCAPSGKFLSSINSNDPDRVLEMMRAGLQAWENLAGEERWLSAESAIKPQHRWEDSFPSDGLIVNVISRDLPAQCDPLAPCEVKWNQDYIWYSKEEARQWLGTDPQLGDVHQLPDELVARLARFHFVDNVKGQTSRFSRTGVKESQITTEVVERTGKLVRLKVSGLTTGVAGEGWWQSSNGVVTRVLGQATFDLEQGAFVQFELVALGRRWGYTRHNSRSRDSQSGPLGYVLRLAAPNAPHVAPASIADYDANWVIRPERR
jgi:hypothetical protein